MLGLQSEKATDKFVLVFLANHAVYLGRCFPSMQTLDDDIDSTGARFRYGSGRQERRGIAPRERALITARAAESSQAGNFRGTISVFLSLPTFVIAMHNDLKLLRVKFRDIAVGQSFYDPISAEYFVKRSEGSAAMISGRGDGTIPDEFEADDVVGIGQN